VTPSADKTPEDIEREMERTRESITEKVAALENQVVGTVQTAADTIQDTVEAVKSIVTQAPAAVTDTVKHAAEAVSETVRETFDITGHVRRHPWASVGSAALLGCMTAWLLTRRGASEPSAAAPMGPDRSAPPSRFAPEPVRAAEEKPGMFDELFGMLGGKAKELAHTALESVSAALKQSIQQRAPGLVDEAASYLTGAGAANGPRTFAEQFEARRARA
jgi:ElaB/YqjD/DUF883 family membrane-anchored ribosome-binding protein